MGQFFDLVVSLDIEANIQAIIIGNTELVSVTIQHKLVAVEFIVAHGKGYRPARLIDKIARKTEPPGKPIVQNQAEIVGLVKIRRKKFAIIDTLLRKITVQPEKRSRIRIAQPTV